MPIGWVDFSKSDRDKVRGVMNLLREPGAVDEIGIGTVRDAFSNRFFPGTSTVQTIAKYFLIVPYVLKETMEGGSGKKVEALLREIDNKERNCGRKLLERCPNEDGIIGKNVLPELWVVRKPSDIYWNGIRTYGICTQDVTIPELLTVSSHLQSHKALGNKGNRDDQSAKDDNDAGHDTFIQLLRVPEDYYGPWFDNLFVRLTKTEAAFLRHRIMESVPDSLLAFILKHNDIDVNTFDSFEALYIALRDRVPEELRYMMNLACDFNRLVYTARVRYNYCLSNGMNEDAKKAWEDIEKSKAYMLSVDVDKVLSSLKISNPPLRSFLISFRSAVLAGNLSAADEALVSREVRIKSKSRAKLLHREDYPNDNWVGGKYLDFRFGSAKQIINDIIEGETAQDV